MILDQYCIEDRQLHVCKDPVPDEIKPIDYLDAKHHTCRLSFFQVISTNLSFKIFQNSTGVVVLVAFILAILLISGYIQQSWK